MRQGIRVVASIVVIAVIALMGVEVAGGGICLDWRRSLTGAPDRYAR